MGKGGKVDGVGDISPKMSEGLHSIGVICFTYHLNTAWKVDKVCPPGKKGDFLSLKLQFTVVTWNIRIFIVSDLFI